MNVKVFNESSFKYLPLKRITHAVQTAAESEIRAEGSITVVICSDSYIHDLNKQFLGHDYPTDVITFKLEESPLEGEIYIGAETAKSQASDYKVSFGNELLRLAIHGVLHLAGYDDADEFQKKAMSAMEDKYLNLIKG